MAPVDILLLLASSEGDEPKVVELLAAGASTEIKVICPFAHVQWSTGPDLILPLQQNICVYPGPEGACRALCSLDITS